MRAEHINGIKRFFKSTTNEVEYAYGLNCRVDGECIGPCFYGKHWLQKHKINPLDNQFYLINDGESYNVVLFYHCISYII